MPTAACIQDAYGYKIETTRILCVRTLSLRWYKAFDAVKL